MEHVILVDEEDQQIGTMEKMEAHRKGALHRAFSVLVFNSKGEMLLQKRAKSKYHSGGLWSNACCSHPRPEETLAAATTRRMKEELGIDAHPQYLYKFQYKANLGDLIEHELDHVFVCEFDGEPNINLEEVEGWTYVEPSLLKDKIKENPEQYTFWLERIINTYTQYV
ncbi:MAG: isopentenyl-diphosphate Delta-isomerase [Cyclobacteriaceae bacterium]|nr:isopentenyl-diphosphate Delta-isomerase [Cyclobacteriaceae bacterium]